MTVPLLSFSILIYGEKLKRIYGEAMLNVITLPLGDYQTNCYILTDAASGETAVVDPGEYTPALAELLKSKGITELKYILLTHGHFDHICGVYSLKENFGGEVMIHSEDRICLESTEWSLCDSVEGYSQTVMSPDREIAEGDTLLLGETEITVMHTPGHTRGGVCFIADGRIFSGDTLFKVGIGRTDLPGGHLRTLVSSLRRIGSLTGDYEIFPGHGDSTTLSYELTQNSLLRSK